MWGNDKNFNVRVRPPIQDVVRKAWYSIAADTGRKLDSVAVWSFTDPDHCRVESGQITRPESRLASLIVGHVLKVLSSRGLVKEVTHLSKACASRRTTSEGMRPVKP